jgi:hypothetical protein
VLSDAPAGPGTPVRTFSHPLGECGSSFFAAPKLANACRKRFPKSLDGVPVLVPGGDSTFRRALNEWFASHDIRPEIIAELDDLALASVMGEAGLGVFAAPDVIAKEIRQRYDVQIVGRAQDIRQRFYAISVDRRLHNPAVAAIGTPRGNTLPSDTAPDRGPRPGGYRVHDCPVARRREASGCRISAATVDRRWLRRQRLNPGEPSASDSCAFTRPIRSPNRARTNSSRRSNRVRWAKLAAEDRIWTLTDRLVSIPHRARRRERVAIGRDIHRRTRACRGPRSEYSAGHDTRRSRARRVTAETASEALATSSGEPTPMVCAGLS